MSSAVPPVAVFNYTKYQTPGITVAQLDALYTGAMNPDGNTGYVAIAWTGIKLIIALAYIFARDKLVSQQEQLALQQYEVAVTDAGQSSVNNQQPVVS